MSPAFTIRSLKLVYKTAETNWSGVDYKMLFSWTVYRSRRSEGATAGRRMYGSDLRQARILSINPQQFDFLLDLLSDNHIITIRICAQRFRVDAKTEPFFMSMTIHPKFIKTELKLV
jgi:hypothetical protein